VLPIVLKCSEGQPRNLVFNGAFLAYECGYSVIVHDMGKLLRNGDLSPLLRVPVPKTDIDKMIMAGDSRSCLHDDALFVCAETRDAAACFDLE